MLTKLSNYFIDADDLDIAFHNGELINFSRFKEDVCCLVPQLVGLQQENIALYYDQAYPFAVAFFALLHSKKNVWIAANNTQTTADRLIEQGCLLLGNWQGKGVTFSEPKPLNKAELTALDSNKQQIIIFTSGSSGQAKAISKSLQQFQTEIEALECYWGEQLADSHVLATVSHQHIYGLLFRILWPLAAGRCFHSNIYLSPEPLLKQLKIKPAFWVASPAQLKRLDDLTDWQKISCLVKIFSSGGALPQQSAKQIYQCSGQKVIEIYGSSETGGIAWRQTINDKFWTLFDNIKLSVNKQQQAQLLSPYLSSTDYIALDDKVELINETQFSLLGRVDRLVKIEEKRLSLNELEQSLNSSHWIEQAHTFVINGKRDKIAAVIVLSELAVNWLKGHSRSTLIKQIREPLLNQFESVVLPRKWLFMQSLPFTTQGKINQCLITDLLSLDATRFPQILSCHLQESSVHLELKVVAKLIYFTGHFPQQPILPGVTQLAWVEQFGKLFFSIQQPFLRMEVIKFKKIICPDDTVSMVLNWKNESNKLYFEITSATGSHSSGRMVYGQQEL